MKKGIEGMAQVLRVSKEHGVWLSLCYDYDYDKLDYSLTAYIPNDNSSEHEFTLIWHGEMHVNEINQFCRDCVRDIEMTGLRRIRDTAEYFSDGHLISSNFDETFAREKVKTSKFLRVDLEFDGHNSSGEKLIVWAYPTPATNKAIAPSSEDNIGVMLSLENLTKLRSRIQNFISRTVIAKAMNQSILHARIKESLSLMSESVRKSYEEQERKSFSR